jgi:hypothetical protein
MTPKQKAIELLGNFDNINLIATRNTKGNLVSPYKSKYLENECCVHNSKKGALICVDEILESHYKVLVGVMPKVSDYWQEVKQEINKL